MLRDDRFVFLGADQPGALRIESLALSVANWTLPLVAPDIKLVAHFQRAVLVTSERLLRRKHQLRIRRHKVP
jgi:hypothetical protein